MRNLSVPFGLLLIHFFILLLFISWFFIKLIKELIRILTKEIGNH